MKKIVIRPLASLDIDEQAVYIAKDNLQYGYRFYESCDQTFLQISKMPQLGQRYSSHNKKILGIRFLPVINFEKHLIFYVVFKNSMEVIRVLYATRDIRKILKNTVK